MNTTQFHSHNEISIKDTKATEYIQEALIQFLNCCTSNPDAIIIYQASNMILSCDSDTAYRIAPKSRSRAGWYYYLGNKVDTQFKVPVDIQTKLIKAVMGVAVEAEVGELYMNAWEVSPMRTTFDELDHPQPATSMRTDSNTTDGIMNKRIKQKQNKSMDKWFYWLQDRIKQEEFRVFWAPGKFNLAYFFTIYY